MGSPSVTGRAKAAGRLAVGRWVLVAMSGVAFVCGGKPATCGGEDQAAASQPCDPVRDVLRGGTTGGIVIHLGFTSPDLAIRFAGSGRFLVDLVTRDRAKAAEAKAALQRAGVYGRVSVYHLREPSLPYADDLARAVLVDDALGLSKAEIRRVVAPMGLYVTRSGSRWSAERKPLQEGMDDWPMTRHDNGHSWASADTLVGPPTNARWIASPKLEYGDRPCYMVKGAVVSGGRLFTVRPTPGLEALAIVARCAFSGILLWSRELVKAREVTQYEAVYRLDGAPPLLSRKWGVPMIAAGNRVFCFGHALDAVSGETIFKFRGHPVTYAGHVLHVSRMDKDGPVVGAIDARTGKELWQRPGFASAVSGGRMFVISADAKGQRVCAYSAQSGAALWQTDLSHLGNGAIAAAVEKGGGPKTQGIIRLACNADRLVVSHCEGSRDMLLLVFSTSTGSLVRSIRFKVGRIVFLGVKCESGRAFHLRDEVAWCWTAAPEGMETRTAAGDWKSMEAESVTALGDRDSTTGILTAVDLSTGRILRRIALGRVGAMCCDPVLAGRHAFVGATSVLNLLDGRCLGSRFYRNACILGFVPAYGLLYLPPTDNCSCFGKIEDAVALESRAPSPPDAAGSAGPGHVEKGPAYEAVRAVQRIAGLAARVDDIVVPPDWKPVWETRLASQERSVPKGCEWLLRTAPDSASHIPEPRVVGDRAVVTVPDEHRVVTVDVRTGRILWVFTADARISGAPTPCSELCVFGCRDGWVYAVRSSDGALAWRTLVAPRRRRIPAFEQFESPWPVEGAVVVRDGRVYATSGRHNLVPDGGTTVSCLNLRSGELVWRSQVPHSYPEKRFLAGTSLRDATLSDDGRTVSTGLCRFDAGTGAVVTRSAGAPTNAPAEPKRPLTFAEIIRQQEGELARQKKLSTPPPATKSEGQQVILTITRDGRLQCYRRPK